MRFQFGHEILYLKSRLYVKLRFVKSRLYCTYVLSGSVGREWVNVASAAFVANRLLKSAPELIEAADWLILPCANPDGYKHSNTTHNRLFKGTRYSSIDIGYFWGRVRKNCNVAAETICRFYLQRQTQANVVLDKVQDRSSGQKTASLINH